MNRKLSSIISSMLLIVFVQGCLADTDKRAEQQVESPLSSEKTVKEISRHSIKEQPVLNNTDSLMPRWIGTYEAEGRACRPEKLTLYKEPKFSWGQGCHEARIQIVSITETEFLFEIDKNSKCNLDAVVFLSMPKPESRVIFMKAYQNMDDFYSKEYGLSCTYSAISK